MSADSTALRKRVYRFLEQRGGSASSVAIVASVLQVRNARLSTAERLVRGLLDGDPAFVPDGLGNWHLDPRRSLAERPLYETAVVVVSGARRRYGGQEKAELAFVAVENGRLTGQGWFRLVRCSGRWQVEQEAGMPVSDAAELSRWLERLQEGVWLAFRPARLRGLLSSCGLQMAGSLPGVEVSLQRLARRLEPGWRVRELADLARACGIETVPGDTALAHARLAAEVFVALLEKLRQRGIDTVEQLVAFEEQKPAAVDFSRYTFGPDFLRRLPQAPGVYLMHDREGEVIYVGKARNLAHRVGSYFLRRSQRDAKTRELLAQLHSIELHRTGNELDALLLEQRLIRRYRPPINQQMEVHLRQASPVFSGNVAFLLPAYRKSRVALFLVSERRQFLRLELAPACVEATELAGRLREFARRDGRRQRGTPWQWQIAVRWFLQHRDEVSWIDLDGFDSVGTAAATVLRLAGDPEALHNRIVYVPQVS